jgi:hypothetical protein
MIRCFRLWSGPDDNSHFEEGVIDLELGQRGDMLSDRFPIASVSFQETDSDPKLGRHPDPARQPCCVHLRSQPWRIRRAEAWLGVRPAAKELLIVRTIALRARLRRHKSIND